MLTLHDLMLLLSVGTPILFTLLTGWRCGQALGLLLGLFIGIVLSAVCVASTRAFFKRMDRHPNLGNMDASAGWVALKNLLCVALAFWIIGIAIVGFIVMERIFLR